MGENEKHLMQFYERNPADRGLEFDDSPDDKPNFVRYAVELRCQNIIPDTRKTPMPPLENLAEAAMTLLAAGLKPEKAPRNELVKLFTNNKQSYGVVPKGARTLQS
jgi:hypothetical protein